MKWCILIWGQRGIYIHEGPDNLQENGGPSAGCIHLAPGNARKVFDWVNDRTRITIDYPWVMGDMEIELWNVLNKLHQVEQQLRHPGAATLPAVLSVNEIVSAAKSYADNSKAFANGCSEMVKSAYAAGGVTIPVNYTANDIMNKYPAVSDPVAGDIAGWTDSPNGHVVIYLGPDSGDKKYSNCPGPGQKTKYNKNMGHSLGYRRPS